MTEKKSLAPEYFEKVYEAKADPWDFQTSEYETAKYQATIDSLPNKNYESAFEIGCSIGVLTARLAARCETLLAVDVSEKALEQARNRCRNLPNVSLEKMEIPKDFPSGKFDLIVVSEVGYYLAPADWTKAMEKIQERLSEKGQIILVHWTPFVDDYPQTGDEVHDSFTEFAENKLRKSSGKRTEKYRLDVWEKI